MKTKVKAFKLTARFFGFFLIFITVYLSLSAVFTPKRDDEPEGMSNNIIYPYRGEEKDTLDIIFIGNSDVARGINPIYIWDNYKITSCTSGPPAVNYKTVFKHIKDACKNQSPKVIVLEVDCLFGASNKYYKLINEEYEKKKSKAPSLGEMPAELDEQIVSGLAFYWPIMKYHERWKELSAKDFTNLQGRFKYSAKGYMYTNEVTPFKYGNEYMSDKTDAATEISGEKRSGIDEIVSFCKERGITLTLLSIPSGSSWSVKKHNAIEGLARELRLDFVDYNYNPGLLASFSWETDTKDGGNHMNYSGATKVTAAYSAHLVKLLALQPTALSEKQKKSWDKDSKIFHKEIVKE